MPKEFSLLNEEIKDIIDYYEALEKKKVFVKSYEIRCYTDDLPAQEFEKLITVLLPSPSRFVFSAHDSRVGSLYNAAVWELRKPMQAANEVPLLHLFHILSSATYSLGELSPLSLEFEVLLVAYDKEDALMKRPYYLHPIPSFHNIWGAREAIVSAKVDSFEGIPIKDLPPHVRQIWIDNMLEGLRSREPQPASVTIAEDHLEVTWNFTRETETNDMLRSVFWLPGHKDCLHGFGHHYDLHEKEDFIRQLDLLQNETVAGDLDV